METAANPPGGIDDYIAGFPLDVQDILQRIRALIAKEAPDAQEAMKYRIPTFVLNGNLVHFAAFAKHIGFYPTPSGIEHFREELSGYPSSKGAIQFPLDGKIPFTLIRKIVKFRVSEARKKSSKKKK